MRRQHPQLQVVLFFTLLPGLLAVATPSRAHDLPPGPGGSKLSVGGEMRLRGEGFNNALDLADSLRDGYNFYRLRTRAWFDAIPRPGLHAYFRLGNEYRWGRGEREAGVRDAQGKLSLDNGWVEFRFAGAEGPSLRFGRQDLLYGEGFLIWDGTPADGSSSSHFDAMKLNWAHRGLSIDLLTAKMDDEGFGTKARDEDLYGLYARVNRFDLYTLYRNKRGETVMDNGTVHPVQQTTALGGRFALLPETGWHAAAEGAYQTGSFAHRQARSFGGYMRGGWTSEIPFHPGVEVGGVYLSGDDPGTKRWEGWDGFYSEWPKYSELYVYTMSDATTRVLPNDSGAWTNFSAAWIEARMKVEGKVGSAVRCTWMQAPEKTGPCCGRDRGFIVAGQINLSLGSDLQGQLLGEFLDPGNFYLPDASTAWYGRWQLTARF